MKRATPYVLLLGLTCAGCGDDEPAMPDTSKTVPAVPERYQRKGLDHWVGLPTDAPADDKVAQAFALASLEKDPIRAAPILLRLLNDDAVSVQVAAVIAAGRLAPPSEHLAKVLAGFLASEDEPLRRHARRALGQFGEHAVTPLGAALADEALRVRWGALSALASIGAPAERLADAVAERARESDDATERRQARLTLARLGPAGAEACAAFIASGDTALRDEAAAAMAHSGSAGVLPLLRLVTADDEVTAAVAAGVIQEIALRGAMGETTPAAVAGLVKALDREGPVRFNAMDALMAIGEPARAPVQARMKSADPELQQMLKLVLEGIGKP